MNFDKTLSQLEKSNNKQIALLGLIYSGKATKDDIILYKKLYLTEDEKKIGKAYFEMTEQEKEKYNEITYNNSVGDLQDYDCKICHNKGDILEYQNGIAFYKPCKCFNIRTTIKNMKECGLDNLLTIYRFDKFIAKEQWQKDVKDKAVKFVNSEDRMFTFLGKSGVGKSHICTAISRELLKLGMKLEYMVWVDSSYMLKQHANSTDYSNLIDKYKECQVLYIDDFFKTLNESGKPSQADIRLANEIIDYRYNKARTENKRIITIISSERTLDEIMTYSEALAGRIVEMSKDNLIMMFNEGYNYRLKKS